MDIIGFNFTFFIVLFIFFIGGVVKGTIGVGLPTITLVLLSFIFDIKDSISFILIPIIFSNFIQLMDGKNLFSIARQTKYFLISSIILIVPGFFLLTVLDSKIILLLFISIVSASFSYAHPPRDLEFSYSHEDEVLLVKFVHVTNDRREHYIRKIEILRAKGEPEKLCFVRQEYTKDIEKDIPITLEAGESITVKVSCKKGGASQETFVVPEVEEQEKEKTNSGG